MARARTYIDSHFNVFVLCRENGTIKTLRKCKQCDYHLSYVEHAGSLLLSGKPQLECGWERS